MNEALELVSADEWLHVKVSGKLTKESYETFVPLVNTQIEEHGKLRILLELHAFHGWTAGALWEDIKFEFKHWKDIERLAIVGESKWEEGMSVFCKPFTSAKIKYFAHTHLEEAKQWLFEN